MDLQQSDVLYAYLSTEDVIFHIVGRGTFQSSIPLKRTVHKMRQRDPQLRFIIDLSECLSMDSTFMGVLASMGLAQRQNGHPDMLVCNVNEHAKKLLDTLGLSHFLDVRLATELDMPEEGEYEPTRSGPVSRRDQILHMLEAHKQLIHIDSRNECRFESVMKYLNESLERETNEDEEIVAEDDD